MQEAPCDGCFLFLTRIMLVIPIGLGIWHLFWPDDMSELINLVIGLPILIVNMWAWQVTELLVNLSSARKSPEVMIVMIGQSDPYTGMFVCRPSAGRCEKVRYGS